jgi:hypothetical protein
MRRPSGVVLIAALLGFGLAPESSQARTQPAYAMGAPNNKDDYSCFRIDGSVKNICTGSRAYVFPLVLDNIGPFTFARAIDVYASRHSAGATMTCRAYWIQNTEGVVVGNEVWGQSDAATMSASSHPSTSTIYRLRMTLPAVPVRAYGEVYCTMTSGIQVYGLEYQQ